MQFLIRNLYENLRRQIDKAAPVRAQKVKAARRNLCFRKELTIGEEVEI